MFGVVARKRQQFARSWDGCEESDVVGVDKCFGGVGKSFDLLETGLAADEDFLNAVRPDVAC